MDARYLRCQDGQGAVAALPHPDRRGLADGPAASQQRRPDRSAGPGCGSGGTNSLHTNALDETLALPTEQSAEVALRTQQVIMEETGVVNVADPLGGSWFVEALPTGSRPMRRQSSPPSGPWGAGPLTGPGWQGRPPGGSDDLGHPARHRGRLVHVRDCGRRVHLPDRSGEGREEGGRRQLPHRVGQP